MLLPPLPIQLGPATDYAKRRRPLLVVVLSFQTVICLLNIFVNLDIMGGFILGITAAMGWLAWFKEMDITYLTSWGMLCLINGVLDTVRLIDIAVRLPLFTDGESVAYNLGSAIRILTPFASLTGALMAWFLYKDYQQQSMQNPMYGQGYGQQLGETRPLLGDNLVQRQQPTQAPFSGEGHRLGTNSALGR
mmetsp:Transcript_15052/g.34281  ORF Transcript_15052/g.34281 Transcript_15052/m.34281 type:complete len:191 (+) Transcript_15052:140-712(+)